MIQEERRRLIKEIIEQDNSVNVSDLQERFQVSVMTIWRDLKFLEKNGGIQRVRGGAVKRISDPETEPFFESKQTIYNQQKKLIAHYTVNRFVHENDIIILEGGTTVAYMVPHLIQSDLTIITNGLNILTHAERHLCRSAVMSCGGILRDRSHTFVGPQAEVFFSGIRAHKFFLGATGINISDGITDPSPLEIQIKRVMHRSAEQTILLLDSSKFGIRSLSQIIPLEEIDVLVTDEGAPQEILADLAALGIEIHIARPVS